MYMVHVCRLKGAVWFGINITEKMVSGGETKSEYTLIKHGCWKVQPSSRLAKTSTTIEVKKTSTFRLIF